LHAAAVDNKVLFTELLLDRGADVNALDASGQRPIDLATENKCDDCVASITNKIGLLFVFFMPLDGEYSIISAKEVMFSSALCVCLFVCLLAGLPKK